MENKEPLTHLMRFLARKGVLSGGALGLNTLLGCCILTNNIHKYYSISRFVISIIIVIAPTILRRFNHGAYTRETK